MMLTTYNIYALGSNQLLRANLHDGSVVGGRPWTAGLPVLFIAVVTTKDQL